MMAVNAGMREYDGRLFLSTRCSRPFQTASTIKACVSIIAVTSLRHCETTGDVAACIDKPAHPRYRAVTWAKVKVGATTRIMGLSRKRAGMTCGMISDYQAKLNILVREVDMLLRCRIQRRTTRTGCCLSVGQNLRAVITKLNTVP